MQQTFVLHTQNSVTFVLHTQKSVPKSRPKKVVKKREQLISPRAVDEKSTETRM